MTNQAAHQASHTEAVKQRINRYIEKVNREHPDWTQAQKLAQAWSDNIEERMKNPTDTVGRDADYYFAARKEVANSSSKAEKLGKGAFGEVAWLAYTGLKLGSSALGHPEWLRTDPDKPNAPVGGFTWMNHGIRQGLGDSGDEVSDLELYGYNPSSPRAPSKRAISPTKPGMPSLAKPSKETMSIQNGQGPKQSIGLNESDYIIKPGT